MASHGKGKNDKASEVEVRRIQSYPEDASANYTASWEEIRLRAYEIYLERGGLPGDKLDDWLQAEREVDGRASQRGQSTDIEGRKP